MQRECKRLSGEIRGIGGRIRASVPGLTVCALMLLASGLSMAQTTPALLSVKLVPLVKIEEESRRPPYAAYVVSPDSHHLAYLVNRGGKMAIVRDRKEGKIYEWILAHSMVYSGDSKHLAYVAQDGRKMFVVVDDVESPSFFQIKENLALSADGKHLAFIAKPDDKSPVVVVADSVLGNPYDSIGAIFFSSKGNHLGYTAIMREKRFFVVDGREAFDCDDFVAGSIPHFSPDGEHWGCIIKKIEKVAVVMDGKVAASFDAAETGTPNYSPDSKRCAYIGVNAAPTTQASIIIDGQASQVKCEVAGSIVFSPDSKRVAYVAIRGGKQFIVLDGKELEPTFDAIAAGSLLFSPDSSRFVYVGRRDKKASLMLDGKNAGDFDQLGGPVFSPDSKRLAYILARDSQVHVVVDDKEQAAFAGVSFGPIVFSSDSKHVAYVADRVKAPRCIVVDGHETQGFDKFLQGAQLIFDSPNLLHTLVANQDFEISEAQVEVP